MLQLVNLTDFVCERALLADVQGRHQLVVAIKASFDLTDAPEPVFSDDQEPVALAPRFLADNPEATLLRDAELTLDHGGTDIVLNASAHAPGGQPVPSLIASAEIADCALLMQVSGARLWKRSFRSMVPGEPEPFTRLPILYEHAFGGGHAGEDGAPVWDDRNPIGRGYCTDPARLEGLALPNIEDPEALLTKAVAEARPPVVGLSARPAAWQPRRALAGTYDDDWLQARMPQWPVDLQPGFFRPAAPQLQSAEELRGNEVLRLTNLTASGSAAWRIPRLIPQVRVKTQGARLALPVALRRIIVEPDLGRMILLWRAVMAAGADGRRLEQITIGRRRVIRATATTASAS